MELSFSIVIFLFKKPDPFEEQPFVLQCLEELSTVAEESGGADAVPLVREYLMGVAKEATASENVREWLRPLPRSLEKYVAYCDILYRLLHLEAFQWQTFVLKDFDAGVHNASFDFEASNEPSHQPVFVEDIPTRVKKALKKTGKFGFVSTQAEVRLTLTTY